MIYKFLFFILSNFTLWIVDNIIAKKLNWTGKINWNTRPHRPGEIYYLSSKNDKATKLFGWEPKVKLEEGIDKTIKLWQNQS